ncbi:MAG: PSD1 and planctomycete cytochrome C domain-containing protein [Pirellulaceae bacterium]
MRVLTALLIAAFACLSCLTTLRTTYGVDFSSEIQPILNQHCVPCHGGVKQVADVSFIYREDALNVIEPGSPEDSYALDRIKSTDNDERMPPPEHGAALSEEEIQLLTSWIEEGAEWSEHWSFVAPQKHDVPQEVADDSWIRSRMDAFVLAKLREEGLEHSADAEPDRWLRRVSLDLTGLPPSLRTREAFLSAVAAEGEAAYEAAVQKLLDSPLFGERWASVWLDAVRYADSKGLGQDGRREIWKYRDWVIKALNADMPFDQFTIKQIAGDLLPNASMDDYVATACQRLTQTNEEGGTDDEQFRLEAVLDRVNTSWQVWQGVTFGCVQCHSHPYDPIRHEEYYKFIAYFNNTLDSDISNDEPRLAVPLSEDDYPRALELDQQIKDLKSEYWRSGFELLQSASNWLEPQALEVSTTSDTQLVTETVEGFLQYHTTGTVAKNTDITLTVPIPEDQKSLTAIRFTGMPLEPAKALDYSEWGFVISHVEANLVDEDGTKTTLPIAYVIGDEAFPILDPLESLNPKSSQGFSAYSRIHHARRAAFVLEAPVEVGTNQRLQLTLKHKIVETGAFPLVAKRGSIATSDNESFTRWLEDEHTLTLASKIKELKKERKLIRAIRTPILTSRPAHLARPSHVFERGNFLTKGDRVQPGTPMFLPSPKDDDATDPPRLQVAKWVASASNPLTARVAVNRFWGQLFGLGIVETQEDFGSAGAKPSNAPLLDDLATRFAGDMQWSVKALLKEITLSSTYRQSSRASEELMRQDPRNRLLARGPRNRIAAEMVRDQALAIAGLISDERYGPPVHPPLPAGVWKPFQGGDKWRTPAPGKAERYRRSIYTYTKRSIPFPMFAAFDAPSREFCSARRLPSNTPLQALMTLNDQTFIEAAEALAKRMLAHSDSVQEQIAYGVKLATCREPKASELEELSSLYDRTLARVSTDKSAKPTDSTDDEGVSPATLAMTNIATVLLNLDEVLCK